MKIKKRLISFCMTFFIVTACITIFQAFFGTIFRPNEILSWDAFFSPPIFGLLSSIPELIFDSSKELSIKQEAIKQICHFIFIEALVCGLNFLSGNEYNTGTWIAIFLSVIIIYIVVYAVMYINDQKSAEEFNERLREYQKNAKQH